MAAHPLRLPTLALVALSICLSIAVIGCASRTISFYNLEQQSNVWLLPIWPDHFDTRELESLIGTSVAIILLNALFALVLFVSAVGTTKGNHHIWETSDADDDYEQLPANLITLSTALLSTLCALISLIFPSLLNQHAPTRDTLQTWTCRWSNTVVDQGQGPPSQFGSICRETRFAFYAQIPLFLLQLALVAMAVYTTTFGHRSSSSGQGTTRRLGSDAEKGQHEHEHELGQVRNASFDTKSESPRSVQEEARGAKTVGFA